MMREQNRRWRAQSVRAATIPLLAVGSVLVAMLPCSARAGDGTAADSIAWPSRYYGTSGRGLTFSGIYGHTFSLYVTSTVEMEE